MITTVMPFVCKKLPKKICCRIQSLFGHKKKLRMGFKIEQDQNFQIVFANFFVRNRETTIDTNSINSRTWIIVSDQIPISTHVEGGVHTILGFFCGPHFFLDSNTFLFKNKSSHEFPCYSCYVKQQRKRKVCLVVAVNLIEREMRLLLW